MGKIMPSVFTTREISAVAAGAACTLTSGASSFSPLLQPAVTQRMAKRIAVNMPCGATSRLCLSIRAELHCTCQGLQVGHCGASADFTITEGIAGLRERILRVNHLQHRRFPALIA